MDSFKLKVRQALCERDRDKFRNYLNNHPELKDKLNYFNKKIKKDLKDFADKLVKDYENILGGIKFNKIKSKELITKVSELMFNKNEDSFTLNGIINSFGNIYLTDSSIFAELNDLTDEKITVLGYSSDALNDYFLTYERIVREVVWSANVYGIEKVLKDDFINIIIRKVIPSKEDYRKHFEMQRDLGSKLISKTLSEGLPDINDKSELNAVATSVFSDFKSIYSIIEEYLEKIVEKDIEQIYKS